MRSTRRVRIRAIQRYTTVPSPYERKHAEGFITFAQSRWAEGLEATWAIREGDTLAGMVGLQRHLPRRKRRDSATGWRPSARGRGLLTEACRAGDRLGFRRGAGCSGSSGAPSSATSAQRGPRARSASATRARCAARWPTPSAATTAGSPGCCRTTTGCRSPGRSSRTEPPDGPARRPHVDAAWEDGGHA